MLFVFMDKCTTIILMHVDQNAGDPLSVVGFPSGLVDDDTPANFKAGTGGIDPPPLDDDSFIEVKGRAATAPG